MQSKNYFLIAVLLLMSQSLFAQLASLSGRVYSDDGKSPLIGANLYFPGTTIGTATNGDGEYSFKNLKAGSYEMMVSYSGFKKKKQTIEVRAGNQLVDVLMQKSEKELGEVVVTGTGTPHHLKSAPVQTELISKKLVKAVSASGFVDLMTTVSPSFDFSPGNMGAFMQLNGLGNDYILVLIDGKRMYGDIGGQNDLNRINPDDIEKIEVVKGASSSLYGSEAIAGVVNIITKKSKRKVYAENSSRISKYASWQQNNKLSLNLGRFSSLTTYAHKESDGWQLSNYEIDEDYDNDDASDDDLVETDAKAVNAYTDYTLNQRFDYDISKKLSVYASGSHYEKEVSVPTTVKKYGYFFNDFSYSAGAKFLINKTDRITLDYNSDQFKYYYIYNQDYSDYTEGQKVLNTKQRRDDINLKYIFKWNDAHLFTLGTEYVNEVLESDGRLLSDKEDAYTFAAFAQDEIKVVKDLSLVAGVRYVQHKEFGSNFTPKLSALYKLNHFNLRATYAKGFKAPTLKELYYHYQKGSTLYLGNTELDAQKSDYYSFSVEYIISKLTLSLSAYQNSVEDMIAYETVETSAEDEADGVSKTREHYNIEEAESRGIDFLVNYRIGAGFTLGGGYSYVDANNKTDDIRLEGVAQNYVNLRLLYDRSWKDYSLHVSLSGRIQDDKFYDGEPDAKGYHLWKLSTSHQFANVGAFQLEASAGIDNLFDYVDDSAYGSNYGTLNPGRTFFIGCNIKFAK
ncbi:TonB-dependent receptor domain-containing protein [Labilibaculum sp.]|uniref:TonB-dependent receptor n=1 Tax=Labilibaculum sp. TaxID=2060723 RepID=UPI003563878B